MESNHIYQYYITTYKCVLYELYLIIKSYVSYNTLICGFKMSFLIKIYTFV